MKVRHGFVSNSSSSSFCILLPKEAYDKAYDESHPFVKACMDVVGFQSKFIKGIDESTKGVEMVCFGYSDGDSCMWEYESPDYEGEIPKDGDYELGPGDAVDQFEELAIKHAGKDNFMSMNIDT
jgi:hypothetical protein